MMMIMIISIIGYDNNNNCNGNCNKGCPSLSSRTGTRQLNNRRLTGYLELATRLVLGKAWYSLSKGICWKSPNLNHFDIKQSKNFNIDVRFLYDFTC